MRSGADCFVTSHQVPINRNQMNKPLPTYPRILAIAPSASGFGLAVIEGVNSLVGWEVKRMRKDMNNECMRKMEEAIGFYEPDVIVIEEGTGRSLRVRALLGRIAALGKKKGIKVAALARIEVRRLFFAEGLGSKDAMAAILAERFPEELGRHLPPKRKEWMPEDARIAMFEAVALSLAFRKS